ncbi:ion transporter [Candidatus Palauibacter sp.]|uniref:ion transporter n=1 Tax=Candidatus Palauibacter sp. TaxID=3101350 RepID=UPI003AF23E76
MVRAEDRKRYMMTWGWIDLLSSVPTVPELRAFRVGRVLRILRFVRGIRAARVVGSFWKGRRAQTTALVAVSVAILTVVGSSIAILYLERPAGGGIGSGPTALWWSFFTVTTGQQADPLPITPAGRAIGLGLMTIGAALVGTLTATLVSWVVRPREDAKSRELTAIREELAAIRALLEAR